MLRQYVLMPGKVHEDDIPIPVQEPGSGKTRMTLSLKRRPHHVDRAWYSESRVTQNYLQSLGLSVKGLQALLNTEYQNE